MFEILYLLTALAGTFGIAMWDLKTSDVSEKACYFMIGLGIFLHAIESFYLADISIITTTLAATGVFLIIGYLLYRTGQWGDGDAAVLVSIGALMATTPSTMPFSLSYFINLAFVGAVYSVIYSLIVARRNGAYKIFSKSLADNRGTLIWLIGLVTMTVATLITFFPPMIMLFVILPFMIFVILFYFFIKAIDTSFKRKILTSKLKEGDVIYQAIPSLGMDGRRIVGLTAAQIRKIRKLKKYVTVADGIRYTPVFFLTLLVTLLLGDLFTILFL